MTSDYYPSCYKSVNRLPYVGRISTGENNVDFIYQFVKHHTKNINNLRWKGHRYLIGTPTRFPNYGDFPRTFCVRTYGFDISTSQWQNEAVVDYTLQIYELDGNYTDIVFHEAVYPIRVSIYEIYNPGNIIRISAKDSDNQWRALWNGSPQIVPPTSRLFSPPLQSCNFKTKNIRLEFKLSTWDYCTKLDAVMLIGTSKLILPRKPEESLNNLLRKINFEYFSYENEDIHNLTTDYENAHLDIVHLQENFYEYCIIRKSELGMTVSECNLNHKKVSREVTPDYVQRLNLGYHSHRSLFKHDLNSAKLFSDESVKLPHCNFSSLPDEVILQLLKKLDLRSLCRMNQVNKHFNNLTRDWSLYTSLNVRNVFLRHPMYMHNIFCYFTLRCKYLQQLDLTASNFSSEDLKEFLNNCGERLTHLRLCRSSVNNTVLLKISKICKNLKKLDLRFCERIDNEGYSYLENLEHLEHLSISYSFHKDIETQTLCKILQKNRQMRELNFENLDLETVAMELRKSCRNLEVIKFNYPFCFLSQDLVSPGINALADCKNLRKIFLSTFENDFDHDSLNKLFSSCLRLEEVYLYGILTDDNLKSLTQCKNLKKLHLHEVKLVTSDLKYSIIFEQCPKLQELHLKYCNIRRHLIKQWSEKYPHVSVLVKTETYLHYHGIEQYSNSIEYICISYEREELM